MSPVEELTDVPVEALTDVPIAAPADVPSAASTVVPAAHQLAILGVDFDPPLDYARILSNGGVTLLVAIENQGTSPESDVTVTARLLDPQAQGDDAPLLYEAVGVRTLAPGEVRIVRFSQVTDLPLRTQYKLSVDLSAVAGEENLSDNRRAYDIVVRESE